MDFSERITLDVRVPAKVLIEDVKRILDEMNEESQEVVTQLHQLEDRYANTMYPSLVDVDVPQLPPFSPPHNDVVEGMLQRARQEFDVMRQSYQYHLKLLEYLEHDPDRLVSMNIRSLSFYYTEEERSQPNSLFNDLEPDDDETWGEDFDEDDEWEALVDDV